MKSVRNVALVSVFAIALGLPAGAQDRHASGRSGNNGSSGGGNVSSTYSSSSSTSTSSVSTVSSTSSSVSQSYDYRGAAHGYSSNAPNSAGIVAPSPQYSSFTTWNMYWDWQHFYSRLQNEYLLNPTYGHRFMVNREPLLTPSLLRIAVRKPLRLSSTLMSNLDALDAMLQKLQNGEQADKTQITLQIREIRKIAKQISNSSDWNLIDQRKDKDILKGTQLGGISLSDSARLREIATDLRTQLQSWYNSSSTNTISASSLTQPSIASLTKGIEKISKAMENSVKRM
jgi:hypothetical protein